MKFTTQNAVSGIQNTADNNIQNQVYGQVFDGLATGYATGQKQDIAQARMAQLQKSLQRMNDELTPDSSMDKMEKMLMNQQKSQLGLMAMNLNPDNMNDILKGVMKMSGDNSMFNYNKDKEIANIRASAYGSKVSKDQEFQNTFNQMFAPENSSAPSPSGGGLFSGIGNAVGGLMKTFGQGAGGSSGVGSFNFSE